MHLARNPIPNEFVDLAFDADPSFLEPGMEPQAIQWIAEQDLPSREVTEPSIDYLTRFQMPLFGDDLKRPTISRYPSAEQHQLSRYALVQLAMASALGTPFGVKGQRNGVAVQDVFPRQDLLDRANSGLGALVAFDIHTDQAFSTDSGERPDFVSLACIRNNERATTGVSRLKDALSLLDSQTIEMLHQPRYSFYRGRPEEGLGVDYDSVLKTDDDGKTTARLGGDTLGNGEFAEDALHRFKQAVLQTTEDVTLAPGYILSFPNQETVHRRKGFTPAADKALRRWVQKIYIAAP